MDETYDKKISPYDSRSGGMSRSVVANIVEYVRSLKGEMSVHVTPEHVLFFMHRCKAYRYVNVGYVGI